MIFVFASVSKCQIPRFFYPLYSTLQHWTLSSLMVAWYFSSSLMADQEILAQYWRVLFICFPICTLISISHSYFLIRKWYKGLNCGLRLWSYKDMLVLSGNWLKTSEYKHSRNWQYLKIITLILCDPVIQFLDMPLTELYTYVHLKTIKTPNNRTSRLGNNLANKVWYIHKISCHTVIM